MSIVEQAEPVSKPVKSNYIPVLDFIRGLAIIHIILYHYFLEYFHGSFLIVPEGISANLSRLAVFNDVVTGSGIFGPVAIIFTFIKNLFAFLFAYGFASVNIFVLLSGFVLTYSLLNSEVAQALGKPAERASKKENWWSFLVKRLKRILIPLYISIILGVGFLYLRNLLFSDMAAAPVFNWLDVAKIIFVPFFVFNMQILQKFNGDLWFITLIFQLYLIFPILIYLLKKFGVVKFLACTFLLTVGYRFIAGYYLSSVPMGVIYPAQNSYYLFSFALPRLFEFALGMALARFQFENPLFLLKLKGWAMALTGLLITLAGFSLDAYKWGWAFSDLVIAFGLFLLFLNIGGWMAKKQILARLLKLLSDSSYENYLLHHYFLNYLLTPLIIVAGLQNEPVFWLFLPVYFVGAILLGKFGSFLSLRFGRFF